MSLDSIASASKSIISEVTKHSTGIPRISVSDTILSEDEAKYLNLYEDLRKIELETEDEQPSDLTHYIQYHEHILNTTLSSFAITNAVTTDRNSINSSLIPLLYERDVLSSQSMLQRQKNSELEKELTGLQLMNKGLRANNVKNVNELLSLAVKMKGTQQMKFNEEQKKSYLQAIEELKQSRKKDLVLNETIIALIGATGIDWSQDEELRELVLETSEGTVTEPEALLTQLWD